MYSRLVELMARDDGAEFTSWERLNSVQTPRPKWTGQAPEPEEERVNWYLHWNQIEGSQPARANGSRSEIKLIVLKQIEEIVVN